MGAAATVITGLSAGAIGWAFTNLVFHRWKEFQSLRRRARFEILYWTWVREADAEQARSSIRKLAFEMLSLSDTSPLWFIGVLKFWSYDLFKAAHALSALSYQIGTNADLPLKAIFRHRVEKALGLPLEFSNEDYRIIDERYDAERGADYDDDPGPDPIDELFSRY
jgi:hypothetical protein